MESSRRGLRQCVAALALEVVVSKSETQGQLSGCEGAIRRTWSSLYLNSRDTNEHVRDERVLTNYCEGNEAIPGLRLVKVHPASVSREHIIRLFVLLILATNNLRGRLSTYLL